MCGKSDNCEESKSVEKEAAETEEFKTKYLCRKRKKREKCLKLIFNLAIRKTLLNGVKNQRIF
jgi:hypothetical protein